MKLFIIAFLLFSNLGFSEVTKSKINLKISRKISNTPEYTSLLSSLSILNKSNIDKNFNSALAVVEKFSEVKNLTENDMPILILILKAIVLMEPLDPSRTAPQMLTESYFLNTNMYSRSLKDLSLEERKVIKDIFKMFGNSNKKGNG